MTLARGSRLGPYEIVAPIGAGGMGEVYRARDTRLDRDVAIKVLPAEFSENARIRFEREARAISALSHPHICTLHDVGRENGVDFLVMEYLEGETLSDSLLKGPLPLAQVLRFGIDIADALDKAHRKGIIHRDLKPSNIMVTASGVKLLDFGLAKATGGQSIWDAAKSKESQHQTAQKPITAEGHLVGTLEFMAPEQLQGGETDARTDIFALGNLLYRMATGKKPFEGSSEASLIVSILERDPPPISSYQPLTPPSLDRVVKSCLAKSPDDRIQTAHDVMLQLSWIAEGVSDPSRATVGAARAKSWTWMAWSAATLALVLITALVVLKLKPHPMARNIRHLTITLPSSAPAERTGEVLAVSPDGKQLVYVAASQLYLREIDRSLVRPIPGTEGADVPFFSPDGRWIGFNSADNKLKKVSLEGGSPITISNAGRIRGASWGPGDTIVFGANRSPLRRVSASGGTPEPLFKTNKNVRFPVFLPGGKHLLYTTTPDLIGNYDQAEIEVLSLETGQSHTVVKGGTYPRYASGHLLYFHSGTLFAVAFDLRTMRTVGIPRPILDDAEFHAGRGVAMCDVSADGTIFYFPLDPGLDRQELVWVDRAGAVSLVVPQRHRYEDGQLSPDGRSILVAIDDRRRREDLWLYEIARDAWTRVTTEADNERPVWSPDGRRFVFSSNRNGPYNLFLMSSDLSTPPKQITNRDWVFADDWSRDGRLISAIDQTTGMKDIWFVSLEPTAQMRPFLATGAYEGCAVFSPDGRWVAYDSDASGQVEVYVVSADGRGRRWMVSTDGGHNPHWNSNGKELFYSKGDALMSVDVTTSPRFESGKPRVLFKGLFKFCSVTRDGKRFLMIRREPVVPSTQINVVEGLLGSGL
jgi:serine/threonine protein kinase/Tol biopolymer transport system component